MRDLSTGPCKPQILKGLESKGLEHRAHSSSRKRVRAGEPEGRYESGRQPGGEPGDRRVGVVWHTQGSGKSLVQRYSRHPRVSIALPTEIGSNLFFLAIIRPPSIACGSAPV